MRSKADETLVIVETLICPLQISHLSPINFPIIVAVNFQCVGRSFLYVKLQKCVFRFKKK